LTSRGVSVGQQRGLLDDWLLVSGSQHLTADQHHCNHSLYALSRDEAQPDAAAGLVEPGSWPGGYPGRIASLPQLRYAFDRRYLGGTSSIRSGGSATLWMHFFWIFGHPEVYVLIIPAFAFASEIIQYFRAQTDPLDTPSW